MTKYIPHIHPHQFPTAKLRIFPHTAVSHFTPILSQFTGPSKTVVAAPPDGGAALILSVSESDCLFSLQFRRGLVLAALLAALLVLQVDFRQVGVVVLRRFREALLRLQLLHRVEVGDERAVVSVQLLARRLQFAHHHVALLLVALAHQLLNLLRAAQQAAVQLREAHHLQVAHQVALRQLLLHIVNLRVLRHQRQEEMQ